MGGKCLFDHEIQFEMARKSLSSDSTIQPLVPLLLNFFSELLKPANDTRTLRAILAAYRALILNPAIDLEPYMHMILPDLLNIILNKDLAVALPDASRQGTRTPDSCSVEVREIAGSVLAIICANFKHKPYHIAARCISTLMHHISQPSIRSLGALYGCIVGIERVGGPRAVRKALLRHNVWKRFSKEIQDMDNNKKDPVSYCTLLYCLSALAGALSRLPECQQGISRLKYQMSARGLQSHTGYVQKKLSKQKECCIKSDERLDYFADITDETVLIHSRQPAARLSFFGSKDNFDQICYTKPNSAVARSTDLMVESTLIVRFIDLLGEKMDPFIQATATFYPIIP